MLRKIIIVVVAFSVLGVLFYLSAERNNEDVVKKDAATVNGQPVISWRKTTIAIEEATEKISIRINAPKIIISGNYELSNKINKAITELLESFKDDFISGVSTAAYKNGETNTLNIDTEVLLLTPRLISLAFTATERLAGVRNNDSERMFFVFDLVNNRLIVEGNELFRDDLAWSEAVKAMKASLLTDYQGDPNCDLFFAPRHNGFAASCIGVDWSRRGEHLSITGDISMSMIQEFLAPSVLSDIIQ
ncbi:MAG: hypothetical protein Q8P06_01060 [Candidatus Azambacteria bacterium]|nr:hypothetical protein [Candidatus Azambacteria bacterium]